MTCLCAAICITLKWQTKGTVTGRRENEGGQMGRREDEVG